MALIAALTVIMARGEGGVGAALPVLGALALGAVRLLPLLQLIYNGWTAFAGNLHNLLDVLDALDRPMPEATRLRQKSDPWLPFAHQIELYQLGFSYRPGGTMVIAGINLTIPRGARLGIVGKTGSGKSTLMDLVMGLLEPTEGTISIDGELLTPANVARWQACIAHVPQAVYLSDGSIAENIAFGVGAAEFDWHRLREAARQAAVADFVEALPHRYETIVGERGVQLSGGQRQRIGIARALYREAELIIFDEATSALDHETERAVISAVKGLHGTKTVLMVAHRLSTVRHCDTILVMEDGRVIDTGGYDELMESSDLFRKIAGAS